MKIKIELTVDIDAVVWDMNYGTGTDAAAVRADVREYCKHTLHGQLESVGVLND